LNLPGLSTTLVYDLHTKLWHERVRLSFGSPVSVDYMHTSPGLTTELLVYYRNAPGIFELTTDHALLKTVGNPTGAEMYCERSFPLVADASGNMVRHHKLKLDAASGTATQPSYTLQWSDNSGRDFVSGRTLQPADVGDYNERFIWRRLGAARSRLYKLSFTTAKQLSLRSVTLEAEVQNA